MGSIQLLTILHTSRWGLTALLPILISLWTSPLTAGEQLDKSIRIGILEEFDNLYERFGKVIWSDGIVAHVFEQEGFNVSTKVLSNRRIPFGLANDHVDCVVAHIDGLEDYVDGFIPSTLPVVVVEFLIYYDHRNAWEPVWPPDETFISKVGISTQSPFVLRNRYKLDITRSANYAASVKIVNSGRADYWIENKAGFAGVGSSLLLSESEGFTARPLYTKPMHVYFQSTERGRLLSTLFNKGHIQLFESGNYARKFFGDGSTVPDDETINNTIKYIRAKHSNLDLPDLSTSP